MSNVAQYQLRYLTVDDLTALASQIHAFPGTLSLVLSNKTLYQYVEYTGTAPVADGVTIIAPADPNLNGRWIVVDAYTSKAVEGTFTKSDWKYNSSTETYTLTVTLVNPVNNFLSKLVDSDNLEVIAQEVQLVKSGNYVTQVVFHVGSVPDCRFAGSYFILKDIIGV